MRFTFKPYLLFVLGFAIAGAAAGVASAQSREQASPSVEGGYSQVAPQLLPHVLPLAGRDAQHMPGGPRQVGRIAIDTSSGAGRPDLVILPRFGGTNGQPGTGFCGFWQNGQNHTMVFYIRNQGSATVPGTQVQIAFRGSSFVQNIASLPPGAQRVVTQVIPPDAWRQPNHPIADFMITADPLENMPESNEGNNRAQDRCRGPAI